MSGIERIAMEPKYLWTIKWQQPYYGNSKYMQNLWALYEEMVERKLEEPDGCDLAKREIERIMRL